MRLPLACMQCFRERDQPDDALYYAEVTDDGLYHLTCRNGHATTTCLQEQKFEVLYELAANAILDGYYREAVVSFTSSLESFYEFYLRVIARKRHVAEEKFEEAWKRIATQSDRQLGAYTFTHTGARFTPTTLDRFPNQLPKQSNSSRHHPDTDRGRRLWAESP